LLNYTADNNTKLFPMVHEANKYWIGMLREHGLSPEAIICPEATEPSFGWGGAHLAWGPGATWMDNQKGSYGMNLWLLPDGAFATDANMPQEGYYRHIEQERASSIPVFGDSPWVGAWPDSNDIMPADLDRGTIGFHARGMFMGRFTIDRHDMAINVSFLDGGARHIQLTSLWSLQWHAAFVTRESPP
jgi:hypothetical protein